jgi:hypothetical protein
MDKSTRVLLSQIRNLAKVRKASVEYVPMPPTQQRDGTYLSVSCLYEAPTDRDSPKDLLQAWRRDAQTILRSVIEFGPAGDCREIVLSFSESADPGGDRLYRAVVERSVLDRASSESIKIISSSEESHYLPVRRLLKGLQKRQTSFLMGVVKEYHHASRHSPGEEL